MSSAMRAPLRSEAFSEIANVQLPVGAVDAATSPHGYVGNTSRLCAGLSRAKAEDSLRIMVLGTSMAAGAGLVGVERAWPTLLEVDAVRYGPFRSVTVSVATGGMSASFALKLHDMRAALNHAHIVIADYSLNDRPTHCAYAVKQKGRELEAAMGGHFMDALLHALGPSTGALFLELFPVGRLRHTITSEAQRREYAAHPQAFLAWDRSTETCVSGGAVREPSTEAAFERATQAIPRCPYDVARNFHWPELVRRALPVLSYPDGACRATNASRAVRARALWDGDGRPFGYPHPSEATHQVVAQLVAKALARHAQRCGAGGLVPTGAWGTLSVPSERAPPHSGRVADGEREAPRCLRPTTQLVARDTRGLLAQWFTAFGHASAAFQPRRVGGAWRYYEDVRGKPGWIAHGTPRAAMVHGPRSKGQGGGTPHAAQPCTHLAECEITFQVRAGALGMVAVEVLHSYQPAMGTLRCGVECRSPGAANCSSHVTIDSRWEARESQGVLSTVVQKPRFAHRDVLLTCLARPSGDSHSPHAAKVKLLAVVGC